MSTLLFHTRERWIKGTWTDLFVPDVSSVTLDDYNIHVIASVLKQWLRDLPSPLMTFELYEEFLRAMGELIISPFSESFWLFVSPEAPPAETQFQRVKYLLVWWCVLVFIFRSARQAGGDTGSVFCDRSAQQDTPQYTGAAHLPSGQVCDEIIINSLSIKTELWDEIQIMFLATSVCAALGFRFALFFSLWLSDPLD